MPREGPARNRLAARSGRARRSLPERAEDRPAGRWRRARPVWYSSQPVHVTSFEGDAMKEVVILGGARTPMAVYNGAFASLAETELGAVAARAALERTGTPPKEIDHVVFGNALQT